MKRGSVVAKVVGIRVLAHVFGLEEVRVNEVLRRSVDRVIGKVPTHFVADPQGLWEEAGRNRERGRASLFVTYYLTSKVDLTPLDITTIREVLR